MPERMKSNAKQKLGQHALHGQRSGSLDLGGWGVGRGHKIKYKMRSKKKKKGGAKSGRSISTGGVINGDVSTPFFFIYFIHSIFSPPPPPHTRQLHFLNHLAAVNSTQWVCV